MISPDFLLQSYHFDLPPEQIAQHPAKERSASRLMVLDRADGTTRSARFEDILSFLPEKCLLVVNNSRVIPARLWGRRPGGGGVEMLLLTPLPLMDIRPGTCPVEFGQQGTCPQGPEEHSPDDWQETEAEALLRPAKKIRPGMLLRFTDSLFGELIEQQEFGRSRIRLIWRGNLADEMLRYGTLPLPPYIRRPKGEEALNGPDRDEDIMRYQTVYAREDKAGSVAAPTAGLHFTERLRKAVADSGRSWAEVTLYVGYGTFSPVRCEDIRAHEMHAEYVELTEETAQAIVRAKQEGRAVVAVGTTSCRVLEGVYRALHGLTEDAGTVGKSTLPSKPGSEDGVGRAGICEPSAASGVQLAGTVGREGTATVMDGVPLLSAYAGWINIFLYPGRDFHVIDGLITNFHLPESSLVMLVSAFAGRERVLATYNKAIDEGFRFFSYGDSMLIL